MSFKCPLCKSDSAVTDSRPVASTIRRRRKCKTCGHKWTTFEFSRSSVRALRAAAQLMNTIEQQKASIAEMEAILEEVRDLSEYEQ